MPTESRLTLVFVGCDSPTSCIFEYDIEPFARSLPESDAQS